MESNKTEKYYTNEFYEHLNKVTDDHSNLHKYKSSIVMNMVQPKKEDTILDVGTGLGTFAFICAQISSQVVGIDFSPKAIELCRKKAQSMTFSGSLEFMQGDATQIPFDQSSFTKVICSDLSEHLYREDHEKLFGEIYRVLGDKGKLILFTPNLDHYTEKLHKLKIVPPIESHVGVESMEHYLNILQKIGFVIHESYYYPTHYPFINNIEHLFIKQKVFAPFFGKRICIVAQKCERGNNIR